MRIATTRAVSLAVILVGQSCFALELSQNSTGGQDRPNILFILTDDQSYRSVSAYPEAHAWVETPNIDRLAEMGVRFASAYVGAWCMPSRISLLTGRLPHGVESIRMEGPYPGVTYDPEKAPFWPKMLRSTGYITAHIGKWHIGQDTGAGRDWDYQASWNRPKGSSSKPTYYYLDQEISFNGAPPVKVDGYATDNYTDWAEQFIRGENRPEDAPWFLWLTYTASHSPFIPAERHQGKYEHVEVPVPLDIYPPRPGKPFYMQQIRDWAEDESGQPQTNTGWAGGEGISLQTLGHQYHETVSAIDEGVGRLINALEETNQLSNTLIIFTSDQGYALGQHGFTRKVAPYDANIRAPLIVSLPGEVAEGKVVSEPVAGVDLIPTILRAASMDLPWRMDGRDLWPLLRQHKFEWSHPMLLTSTGWTYGDDTSPLPVDGMDGHSRLTGIPWYVMLRHDRFKYIRTLVPNEIEELYDLNLDPGEFFNLASRREFQTVLKKYRSMALDELGRTEAPFVDQLPDTKKFVPTIN